MQLYIGNKNYSSWSMRSWVLMKQAGIPFDEIMVRFDSFDEGSQFKSTIDPLNPMGTVPVLVDDGFAVWDTLAIAEYLAELFPEKHLWPQDTLARARARTVCAEMHAGFGALRHHCGMNIEASLPEVGVLILKQEPAVRRDLARLIAMWTDLLERSSGPLLFGGFAIPDAYFAPVVMRIRTYGLPVPPAIATYIEHVCSLPGVASWMSEALAEHDFRPFEEPYRAQA